MMNHNYERASETINAGWYGENGLQRIGRINIIHVVTIPGLVSRQVRFILDICVIPFGISMQLVHKATIGSTSRWANFTLVSKVQLNSNLP